MLLTGRLTCFCTPYAASTLSWLWHRLSSSTPRAPPRIVFSAAFFARMRSETALMFSFFLVMTLALTNASGIRQCWYPDGVTPAAQHVPCYTSGESHCCLEGMTCLSNGLCMNAGSGVFSRDSCTDPTWSAAICPTLCPGEQHGCGIRAGIEH